MAKRKPPIDKSKMTMEQLLSQYKNPYAKELSIHEMLVNQLKQAVKSLMAAISQLTLESLYFLMHGRK
jgi:hypothetical protein